ncbi:RWP-RK domain-containing protein [Chloropicon roscoffensis]|uniref:RWP-RK domain-containing protein n=1 Tax=Chloropicon roscoffensis TaxID=1461544 RepID=A0AAX4PFW7_9CHLO
MVESVSHLTQAAAACRLGVSGSSICKYRKNYVVPVQKVSSNSRRRRIDSDDLERLYGLSIREACENLNVSRRTLDRRCVELGLRPWPRTRRVWTRRAPAPSAVPDAEPASPQDVSSGSVENEAESYQGRVDCTPPQPDYARLAARWVAGQAVPGPMNFATTSVPQPPVRETYQGRVDCTPPQPDYARLAARWVAGQAVPGPMNFATTSVPQPPVRETYQGRVDCTPPQPDYARLAARWVAGQAVPGPMNFATTSVPQPPVRETYQGRVDCTPPQPNSIFFFFLAGSTSRDLHYLIDG